MNKPEFNQLPEDIQIKIKKILTVFDQCYLEYNPKTKSYEVSTCVVMSTNYRTEFLGGYKAKEAMTKEEYIKFYREEFGHDPAPYYIKRAGY